MKVVQHSLLAIGILCLTTCMKPAWADLAEDVSQLTPETQAAFAATLTGNTEPLPLPILTTLPGFQGPGVVAVQEVVVEVVQSPTILQPVAQPTNADPGAFAVTPPEDLSANAPGAAAFGVATDEAAFGVNPEPIVADGPIVLEVDEPAPAFAAATDPCQELGDAVIANGVGLQVVVAYWHCVALTMHQRDYSNRNETDVSDNPDVNPTQPGPCFTARALAIVHLAIYDALVGVTREGEPYLTNLNLPNFNARDQDPAAASAIGWAAFSTLRSLYPEDAELNVRIRNFGILVGATFPFQPFAIFRGIFWGAQVSRGILSNREGDESGDRINAFVDYVGPDPPTDPFQHFPDPTSMDNDRNGTQQRLYAPNWGSVTPFGHSSTASLPPLSVPFTPPPLGDAANIMQYFDDFIQVLDKGSATDTTRTETEEVIGIFWAYDGALSIGTPPRLYAQNIDQMVSAVLTDADLDSSVLATGFQLARLYAMTHTAMADSTIAAWRDKYAEEFNLWRPIIGIRFASLDTVADTAQFEDPEWQPLGAPRTNRNQPGENPAFPAYPSGHATIGTSGFTVAQLLLNIPTEKKITMVSDEYNGVNRDRDNVTRPVLTKELTVSEAITQNKISRVFLGVHWNIDSDTGGVLGEAIAKNIVSSFPFKA